MADNDDIPFNRDFPLKAGVVDEVRPGVRRILCNNPSPFTFTGTVSYIVGTGKVAIIDPGPDDEAHAAVLLDAVRAVCGGPIGYAALSALRLEAGVPWFGYDFGESVIPHEAGLENSHINYSKGCYTGQEIVERVRSRGHVNRVRAGVEFSGVAVPERGIKLSAGGKEVGNVTRAAFSLAVGHPIGMAYLRREVSAVGSSLEYSGGTARVIALPLVR